MQPDAHPEKKQCAWCGEQAYAYALVQEAIMRKKGDVPVVIEPAEYAPICWECDNSIVRREDPIEVRKRNTARAKDWKKMQETFDGT